MKMKKIISIILGVLSISHIFLGYLTIEFRLILGNSLSFLADIERIVSQMGFSGAASQINSIERQMNNLDNETLSMFEYVDFMSSCSTNLDKIVNSMKSFTDSVGSGLSWLESATGGLTSGVSSSYDSYINTITEMQWQVRLAYIIPGIFSFMLIISVFACIVSFLAGKPKATFLPLICNIILTVFAFYLTNDMPFSTNSHIISVNLWVYVSLVASFMLIFFAREDDKSSDVNIPNFSQPNVNFNKMNGGVKHFNNNNANVNTNTNTNANNTNNPKSKNIYCITCGKKQGFGEFCVGCGRNLSDPPVVKTFCGKCSKPRANDAKFCPHCGTTYN